MKKRLFKDEATFARAGGFTTLPLVLRRLQFRFEPRAWQVYTYVAMRTGPEGVAWFHMSEMAYDLDFKSVSKLKPYVDSLVSAGWLRTATSSGLDYYLVRDPLNVISELRESGQLTGQRLEEIDELMDALKKEPPAPNVSAQQLPATGMAPPPPPVLPPSPPTLPSPLLPTSVQTNDVEPPPAPRVRGKRGPAAPTQ